MQKCFENSQFFTSALIINSSSKELSSFGLITEKEFADFLNIQKGIFIKKSHIIYQIIDLIDKEPFDNSITDSFKKQITQKYSNEFETIYAILVTRYYDEERRYHQYYFVFAKLE